MRIATSTNVFALRSFFERHARILDAGIGADGNAWVVRVTASRRAPNRVEAVDAPHLRRCVDAGLVTVDTISRELVLTDAGVTVITGQFFRHHDVLVSCGKPWVIYKSHGMWTAAHNAERVDRKTRKELLAYFERGDS